MCKKENINPKFCTLKDIKVNLKSGYHHYWTEYFLKKYGDGSGGKYDTYVTFKTRFMYEPYLNQIQSFKHRASLTKFRLSNHCLKVETGRYDKPFVPRGERFCSFCKILGLNEVEDELHFLLKCSKFYDGRQDLLSKVPNISDKLTKSQFFIFLMSAEDDTIREVARFCAVNLPKKGKI